MLTIKRCQSLRYYVVMAFIFLCAGCQTHVYQTHAKANTHSNKDSSHLHKNVVKTNLAKKQSVNKSDIHAVETLEVIGTYSDKEGDTVEFISTKTTNKFITVLNKEALGKHYIHLKKGDRVKIIGDYQEKHPVKIVNISKIVRMSNPDKENCEATAGRVWQPQGKLRKPRCISLYSDAGKPCTSSKDCQGKCIVTRQDQSPFCAGSSSNFGCKAVVEKIIENGKYPIRCVD